MTAPVGHATGGIVEVNPALVFMFRKHLVGMSTGSVANFEAMMAHIADTGLRPVLDDRIREFEGLKDALQAFPRGEHFGKVVVRVD